MKKLLLIVGLVGGLLGALPAQASIVTVYAALSGAAENPPSASLGSGYAVVSVDDVLHTMLVRIDFVGLTGTTTASHVHCCVAAPGNVSPATVLPSFTGFPTGVTSGTYDHTFDTTLAATWNPAFVTANGGTALGAEAAFVAGLRAGRAYVNVHTTFSPGGEIRGFLVPEPPTAAIVLLALAGLGAASRRQRV